MLDILLVTMSFIAAVSMMFLCWLAWTLNDHLQHNDEVINKLQDEIEELRIEKQALLLRHMKEIEEEEKTPPITGVRSSI